MPNHAPSASDFVDQIVAAWTPAGAPEDQGLALVAREGGFGDRYRVWSGRSGKRYLVTVMPLGEAMRVESGVVLVVAFASGGARRIVWAGESGTELPGFRLAAEERIEAHVHLLAADALKRREAVADLLNGAQGYSSVLEPSLAASHASAGSTTPRLSSSRAVLST